MSLLPDVPADAEAIRRSADEPGAFTVVFDRHFEAIHHYAQRRLGIDLADDVAAEVFARAAWPLRCATRSTAFETC